MQQYNTYIGSNFKGLYLICVNPAVCRLDVHDVVRVTDESDLSELT